MAIYGISNGQDANVNRAQFTAEATYALSVAQQDRPFLFISEYGGPEYKETRDKLLTKLDKESKMLRDGLDASHPQDALKLFGPTSCT
jgi:hypothetical protein